MSPQLDPEHFFWPHARLDGHLYVRAADVTEYLRRWASRFDEVGAVEVGNDVRVTADELDAEWIGFITDNKFITEDKP